MSGDSGLRRSFSIELDLRGSIPPLLPRVLKKRASKKVEQASTASDCNDDDDDGDVGRKLKG